MNILTTYLSPQGLLQVIGVVLVLTPYATSMAGEIYKTVDAQGHIVYSDQPSLNAKRVTLPPVPKSASAERERIAKEMQSYAQADAQRADAAQSDRTTQADRKAVEERRKQACTQARNRYWTFAEARRPYRRDEQGNRVYYSSAEIDAERLAAEKDMNRLCAVQ